MSAQDEALAALDRQWSEHSRRDKQLWERETASLQERGEQLATALEKLSAGMWEGTSEADYSTPRVTGRQVREARAALRAWREEKS